MFFSSAIDLTGMSDTFVTNTPGGIFIYSGNEDEEFLYISQNMLDMRARGLQQSFALTLRRRGAEAAAVRGAVCSNAFLSRIHFQVFSDRAHVDAYPARPVVLVLQRDVMFRAGDFIHIVNRIAAVSETVRRAVLQALSAMDAEILFDHRVSCDRRVGNDRDHAFDDKISGIRLAHEAGLSVCSGGIIGMA